MSYEFKTYTMFRLDNLQARVEKLEKQKDPFKGDQTVQVTLSRSEAEALWEYLKDKTFFPALVSDPKLYAPTVKLGQALGVIP